MAYFSTSSHVCDVSSLSFVPVPAQAAPPVQAAGRLLRLLHHLPGARPAPRRRLLRPDSRLPTQPPHN